MWSVVFLCFSGLPVQLGVGRDRTAGQEEGWWTDPEYLMPGPTLLYDKFLLSNNHVMINSNHYFPDC